MLRWHGWCKHMFERVLEIEKSVALFFFNFICKLQHHPKCCSFWKLDIKNPRMLLLRTSMEPFWSKYQFGSTLDVWFQQPIGALVDGTQAPKSMVLHELINVSHLFQSQEILLSISWTMVFTLSVLQNKITVSRGPKMAFYAKILTQSWSISEVYQPKKNPKYGTGK